MNFSTRWNLKPNWRSAGLSLVVSVLLWKFMRDFRCGLKLPFATLLPSVNSKPRTMVRRQLYEAKGDDEDDENEMFEGQSEQHYQAMRHVCSVFLEISRRTRSCMSGLGMSLVSVCSGSAIFGSSLPEFTPPELEKG